MKLALAIVAILVLAASFYADYKWRRWMAARRQDHDKTDRSQVP